MTTGWVLLTRPLRRGEHTMSVKVTYQDGTVKATSIAVNVTRGGWLA